MQVLHSIKDVGNASILWKALRDCISLCAKVTSMPFVARVYISWYINDFSNSSIGFLTATY